jgi:thiosulfate dehydrogenase [quinone] large subunit
MTTIPASPPIPVTRTAPRDDTLHVTTAEGGVRWVWAVTRLALGWTFLWPFLDKTFGLGHETSSAKAWIHGGSPTSGFLSGAAGPFAGIYHGMSGSALADWGFMLGLLFIGVALLTGIGVRVAAVAGSVLLVLMWSASLPPANNPFMDDHLIYAAVLVGLAMVGSGATLGFGRWWTEQGLVRDHAWLR